MWKTRKFYFINKSCKELLKFFTAFVFLLIITPSTFANNPETLLAKADSLSEIENYSEAIALYKKVLSTFTEAENVTKIIAISTQIAINFQYDGNYENAILFQDSIFNNTDLKGVDSDILALAYHKKGVSHYTIDEYEKSVEFYQKALDIRSKIYKKNHLEIIRGNRNIGVSYYQLENYKQAGLFLDKALKTQLSHKEKDTTLLASTHLNLGLVFAQKEDFKKAEEQLLQALSLYKILYEDEPWEIALIHIDLFLFYRRSNIIPKMIFHSQAALSIYDAIEDKYDEDWWGMANNYNNLGISYELKIEFEKAIAFYNKSIDINKKMGKERLSYLADNYNNISGVYQQKKDFSTSLSYLNKASTIFESLNDNEAIADSRRNIGKVYQDSNQFEAAIKEHTKSITYLLPDSIDIKTINPETVFLGSKPIMIENLISVAQTHHQLYKKNKSLTNLKEAAHFYQQILPFIDAIKADFESDESKSFLVNKARGAYEEAVEVFLELYQQEKNPAYIQTAFEMVERSKGIILLDAVTDAQAKTKSQIPDEFIEEELQIKKQIAKLEQQIAEADEATDVTTLRGELIAKREALSQLVSNLENDYPDYYNLKYSTTIINPAYCQKNLLKAQEAMIQYFKVKDKIHLFYIPSEGATTVYTIEDYTSIKTAIQDLRDAIYQPFVNTKLKKAQRDSLHQVYVDNAFLLYKKLVAPIATENNLPQKLYIIPDDVLGYLPFDALLTQSVEGNQYATFPYLGKKHRLSYSYSATLLNEMKNAEINPSKNQVLAFAPTFSARSSLAPLLYNKEEVKAISDFYKTQSYLDAEANKSTFLNQANEYALLHLSSHARMNDQSPDDSFISFTQQADSLSEQELLYMKDLYNMRLQSELVVLSACETALGQLQSGEGIISLARAFSYAGAKSILTTQWRVNDQRTTELIVDFYKNLHEQMPKDEALFLAKNKMIDGGLYAHPYYWAGFIPIGDMGVIKMKNTNSWITYAGILVGAILIWFLYALYGKRKK